MIAVDDRISIYSACNQRYWDKFGASFTQMAEAMNPRPAKLILVTDVEAEFPDWWTVLPFWDERVWPAFDKALEYVESEWVMLIGVDERLDPDFLVGLELKGDAVHVSCRHASGECHASQHNWQSMILTGDHMPGFRATRMAVLREVPERCHKWRDWIGWLELRVWGAEVHFDKRAKMFHFEDEEQVSWHPDDAAVAEVRRFFEDVKAGRVIRGSEWPARLKDVG
jgi:hypothetical protein